MASNGASDGASDGPVFSGLPQTAQTSELLLREMNHRCSNDLQLVVSLLSLQRRRAVAPETRQALGDAMERVAILARSRRDMLKDRTPSLDAALRPVCEALQAQAEPRSIIISLAGSQEVPGLSATQITTLALVVNELVTNAVKHAFGDFAPDGSRPAANGAASGRIRIMVRTIGTGGVAITVDDDGHPFPPAAGDGLGMGLAKRLMASIGGLFILPPPGSKSFELRVPNRAQ